MYGVYVEIVCCCLVVEGVWVSIDDCNEKMGYKICEL